MTSAILQYKTQSIDVLLTPIQFRIVKMLEKHPGGLFRGLHAERGSLMKLLNSARTTIYDNLKKLQKLGLVEKNSKNAGNRGRPKEYWKLSNVVSNLVLNAYKNNQSVEVK